MKILRNFSIFKMILYGKDQNLLDSEISCDFATEIVDFSENDFRNVRKKVRIDTSYYLAFPRVVNFRISSQDFFS